MNNEYAVCGMQGLYTHLIVFFLQGTHSNCMKCLEIVLYPICDDVNVTVVNGAYILSISTIKYLCNTPEDQGVTLKRFYVKKKIKNFLRQQLKCLLPLESGNLQLEQTKFPVFWQNFQIPCVSPDREFVGHFPCAVGILSCDFVLE